MSINRTRATGGDSGDSCEASMARTRQSSAVVLPTNRTSPSTPAAETAAAAGEVPFDGMDASDHQMFESLADFGGRPDLLSDLFR